MQISHTCNETFSAALHRISCSCVGLLLSVALFGCVFIIALFLRGYSCLHSLFFRSLKSEMYYLRKFNSADELILAIENYMIIFYKTKRYQKRLRCMTPMEFNTTFAV